MHCKYKIHVVYGSNVMASSCRPTINRDTCNPIALVLDQKLVRRHQSSGLEYIAAIDLYEYEIPRPDNPRVLPTIIKTSRMPASPYI